MFYRVVDSKVRGGFISLQESKGRGSGRPVRCWGGGACPRLGGGRRSAANPHTTAVHVPDSAIVEGPPLGETRATYIAVRS